jgi:hypothetical protein
MLTRRLKVIVDKYALAKDLINRRRHAIRMRFETTHGEKSSKKLLSNFREKLLELFKLIIP